MQGRGSERTALLVLCASAGALLTLARRRRRRRVFAPMASEPPAATRAALERHRWLPLRHRVVPNAIDPCVLERAFDAILEAFSPQQVNYSNTAYGKDHWALSCFMEYTNGVAVDRIDLSAGQPMFGVCAEILAECDKIFLPWYEEHHPRPRGGSRTLHRLQSFVTRYRPNVDETHLPRHIDGANVDGSLVLGLPTYSGFGDSGGLTVWDGEADGETFVYPVACGDACLLGSRVWHQSNPISHGERWVIVIFYEVQTSTAHSTASAATRSVSDGGAGGAKPRSKVVRELLAKRMVDAAKRKALTEASPPPAQTETQRSRAEESERAAAQANAARWHSGDGLASA